MFLSPMITAVAETSIGTTLPSSRRINHSKRCAPCLWMISIIIADFSAEGVPSD